MSYISEYISSIITLRDNTDDPFLKSCARHYLIGMFYECNRLAGRPDLVKSYNDNYGSFQPLNIGDDHVKLLQEQQKQIERHYDKELHMFVLGKQAFSAIMGNNLKLKIVVNSMLYTGIPRINQ